MTGRPSPRLLPSGLSRSRGATPGLTCLQKSAERPRSSGRTTMFLNCPCSSTSTETSAGARLGSMPKAKTRAINRMLRIVFMVSPALPLLHELVELFHLEEVTVQLRTEELQAAEIDLLLNLVPGRLCHVPEVICGLEEDVGVSLLSTVGHELRFLEVVTGLLALLLHLVDLAEIKQGVGRATTVAFLARDLEGLLELAQAPIHLPDHRLAEAYVDAHQDEIVPAGTAFEERARAAEALHREREVPLREVGAGDAVQRVSLVLRVPDLPRQSQAFLGFQQGEVFVSPLVVRGGETEQHQKHGRG